MVTGVDVEVELVDVDVDDDVVVVSDGGAVVVVLEVVVVEVVAVDGGCVVVVVGSDGGGGSGGRSMSPRSGNPSWEQSMGSPVRPSTKLQYSSWHPVSVALKSTTKHTARNILSPLARRVIAPPLERQALHPEEGRARAQAVDLRSARWRSGATTAR
jgi:hypothetical protein